MGFFQTQEDEGSHNHMAAVTTNQTAQKSNLTWPAKPLPYRLPNWEKGRSSKRHDQKNHIKFSILHFCKNSFRNFTSNKIGEKRKEKRERKPGTSKGNNVYMYIKTTIQNGIETGVYFPTVSMDRVAH